MPEPRDATAGRTWRSRRAMWALLYVPDLCLATEYGAPVLFMTRGEARSHLRLYGCGANWRPVRVECAYREVRKPRIASRGGA